MPHRYIVIDAFAERLNKRFAHINTGGGDLARR
jgi:hypothetical protein